jgi:hypothetical protein
MDAKLGVEKVPETAGTAVKKHRMVRKVTKEVRRDIVNSVAEKFSRIL